MQTLTAQDVRSAVLAAIKQRKEVVAELKALDCRRNRIYDSAGQILYASQHELAVDKVLEELNTGRVLSAGAAMDKVDYWMHLLLGLLDEHKAKARRNAAMDLAGKGSFRCMVDNMEERATRDGWDEDKRDLEIGAIMARFKVDSVTYFDALGILASL